jgi:hypothetical protein
MKKIAPLAFITLLSAGLAACNQTTVASSPSGNSRTGYNSAAAVTPASVSAAPARQAQAMGRSFDAGCRAQYPVDSSGYSACLQNIPANALVAANH